MQAPPDSIRLLIADDHAVVLVGLRMLFLEEPGLKVVAEAATPDQALEKARAYQPDIALMDVRFGAAGDLSGIDACRRIRSELPETRVIMFTSHSEGDSVLNSVLAGASGYLTKNVGPAQLIAAIRAVHRGESLLDPSVTGPILRRLQDLSRQAGSESDHLSPREKEVLILIAEGFTNKEIAAKLIVSPFTARNHVIRILEKLGLSNRAEAAAQAVRMGLLRG
jgi:DNA-binding NarL/FixJ family response regulator